MSYHKDDGTTIGGIVLIASIVVAFCAGYWARDNGLIVHIKFPTLEQRRTR